LEVSKKLYFFDFFEFSEIIIFTNIYIEDARQVSFEST